MQDTKLMTSAEFVEAVQQADPSGKLPVAYLLTLSSTPRPLSVASADRDEETGEQYVMVH
jgi:hypothetical protein